LGSSNYVAACLNGKEKILFAFINQNYRLLDDEIYIDRLRFRNKKYKCVLTQDGEHDPDSIWIFLYANELYDLYKIGIGLYSVYCGLSILFNLDENEENFIAGACGDIYEVIPINPT